MSTGYSKLPFGLSVLLGILSCVLIIAMIASLGQVVKWVGYVFLWIPSQLGIIRTAAPSEVIAADFSVNPTTVTFSRPGAYDLYTSNLDLLELADAVDENSRPWLVLQPAEGGEDPLPVMFIARGLAPFDTPFAKGRPIFYFVIENPGVYTVRHPSRSTLVYFVPDYTTGHEKTLVALYLLELLLIGLPLGSLIRQRWHARSHAVRLERERKRARADALWEEYRAKQAQKPEQLGRKKRW